MEIEALAARVAALEEDGTGINETLIAQMCALTVWKDVLKAIIETHPRLQQFEERFERLVSIPYPDKHAEPYGAPPGLRQVRDEVRDWIAAAKRHQARLQF